MTASLPAALLCATTAMTLAFVPGRVRWEATAAIVTALTAAFLLPVPRGWRTGLNLVGWMHMAISVAAIYRAAQPGGRRAVYVPALGTGIVAGAGMSATSIDIAQFTTIVPVLALAWPASSALRRWGPLPLRVLASWLLAAALLATVMPFLPASATYLQDHME